MDLTLFPAGMAHANAWHAGGGRVIHLEFDPAWYERLGGDARWLVRPGDYPSRAWHWIATRLERETEATDDASALAIQGLVLELLAACARAGSPERGAAAPPWLGRVVERLRADPATRVTLDALAIEAGICADHLARVFRRCLGTSLGDYVRGLRVDAACRLLAEPGRPLGDIAVECGFADQSHMNRVFRQRLAVTPLEVRARLARRRTRPIR